MPHVSLRWRCASGEPPEVQRRAFSCLRSNYDKSAPPSHTYPDIILEFPAQKSNKLSGPIPLHPGASRDGNSVGWVSLSPERAFKPVGERSLLTERLEWQGPRLYSVPPRGTARQVPGSRGFISVGGGVHCGIGGGLSGRRPGQHHADLACTIAVGLGACPRQGASAPGDWCLLASSMCRLPTSRRAWKG